MSSSQLKLNRAIERADWQLAAGCLRAPRSHIFALPLAIAMNIPAFSRIPMRISVSLGTIFLVLNSVVVGTANAAPAARVLSPSVCELVSIPKRFHDRIIRVNAEVNSDGIERTVIFSDRCPDKGVSLIVPPKVASTEGAIALRKAIYGGSPGTTGKHISATFTGKFLWHPKEVPSRMLVLQDVKNVKVD